MGLTRTEGWELRLAAALEDARNRKYQLGTHDCLRVALSCVAALTGVNLWGPFDGQYATYRQSVLLIADVKRWPALAGREISEGDAAALGRLHGIFRGAFTFLFDADPQDVKLARRGDVCEYTDGQPHLGVCNGATVAVLKDSGLAFVPLQACNVCWRIG